MNVMITFVPEASGYRLPTETQWEFAARGGQEEESILTLYAGSNDIHEVARFVGYTGEGTHRVAKKMPNKLGLYDMSGNTTEWVWDWYAHAFQGGVDPLGPSSGYDRVKRGGYCYGEAKHVTILARTSGRAARITSDGFRVALTLDHSIYRCLNPRPVPLTAP